MRRTHRQPSKRDVALAVIRADVYENGHVTHIGLRAYVENRISRRAFGEAIRDGILAREKKIRNSSTEG